MSPRANFGQRLRAQRERRGITLEAIADSTKIKLSLLKGLEHSDISRWPRGIFRRAYVREYAVAVGLDPQPLVAEFVHLFPEDGPAPDAGRATGETSTKAAPPLRLSLATEPRDHVSRAVSRVVAAVAEVSVVLALGGLVTLLLGGMDFLTAAGLVALLYYPLAAACTGRTLRLGQLPASIRRFSHSAIAQAHATRRKRMYLVPTQRQDARAADVTADSEFPRRTAAS